MLSRRNLVATAAGAALAGVPAMAQQAGRSPGAQAGDRVLLANEDSNTLVVID
ncbi:MAG: YncE family protein, partial [Gemmatimonadaceae bacterium]|nr:YncE family protein [Acetobacteraceae bacterium]